jgi:hypothetical protein
MGVAEAAGLAGAAASAAVSHAAPAKEKQVSSRGRRDGM